MPEERRPFFGRELELAWIASRLAPLADGRAAVVFVEGEPGIGKSCLLQTALDRSGWRTVVSAGDPLTSRLPFAMLADAFGCTRSGDDPCRAAVADAIASARSEQEILNLFVELVESELFRGPLLCGMDDLQWADRSTVLAVRYLSRSLRDLPLGFIGSSRLLPRGADVAALFATEGADLLTMGPLDAEASRQLLLSTISTAPPGEMEWWLARAGGNPLFILETASAVKAEGESVAEGALPTSLLASVRRHLGYVPADAMSVLRLAAVLGSSFSLEHLAAVARLPIHDVLAPIQAALEAGILVEKDSLLVFRHELIREALYDELPAEGRRLLHADTASVLLMLDAPGLVVAEHLLSSERPPDDDELVRLLSAADQVTNAKDRAELLERILALTAPSHRQRTEVVSRAITALTQAARGPEADDLVAAERAMDEGSIGGKVALSYLRSLSERKWSGGQPPDVILFQAGAASGGSQGPVVNSSTRAW